MLAVAMDYSYRVQGRPKLRAIRGFLWMFHRMCWIYCNDLLMSVLLLLAAVASSTALTDAKSWNPIYCSLTITAIRSQPNKQQEEQQHQLVPAAAEAAVSAVLVSSRTPGFAGARLLLVILLPPLCCCYFQRSCCCRCFLVYGFAAFSPPSFSSSTERCLRLAYLNCSCVVKPRSKKKS